jgi:hypothetical protein
MSTRPGSVRPRQSARENTAPPVAAPNRRYDGTAAVKEIPARLSHAGLMRALLSQSRGYDAAALGMRLRELRWKNSAWLATAETIAGWNGFEIRNAGSGRSPVRKRSG